MSTEKVIALLDHRGNKRLAVALRKCRFECISDSDNNFSRFDDPNLSRVQIYAPLDIYEYLRGLEANENNNLLGVIREIFGSREDHVSGMDFILEMEVETDQQLVSLIEEQKALMIDVATGGQSIGKVNEQYKNRRKEIANGLQSKGISDPNTFRDLWDWYKRWKSGDLPTYASRRQFVSALYDSLLESLQDDSNPKRFKEPTGWTKVDRTVGEVAQRLKQAKTEEQFQAVGTLCREALISLAQAVFDASRHPTLDGVEASSTDFKRMIEAYIAVELGGASHEAARKHAKAAFDLANELQHKRTAEFRLAAMCAEATTSVVNLIAIVSGQRDSEG